MDKPEIDLKVKHSTEKFYEDHREEAYPMKRRPRGKALILNVKRVQGTSPRDGTDIDRDKLQDLLCQLYFEVTVCNDIDGLHAEGMLDKLETFSRLEDQNKAECVVVCILSHGGQECVFGTDGKTLKLDKIFQLFDNRRCINLSGKPKIFIFQACRGGKKDDVTTDSVECDSEHLPSITDMLKCFPTQDGYVSWRDTKRGSWFIGALVRVFMEYACNEDVCAMLHRVNNHVAKEGDKNKQMSEYISTLTQPRLYFFPGIKK